MITINKVINFNHENKNINNLSYSFHFYINVENILTSMEIQIYGNYCFEEVLNKNENMKPCNLFNPHITADFTVYYFLRMAKY